MNITLTNGSGFPKLLAPIEGLSKTAFMFNQNDISKTGRTMGTSEASFNIMTSRALNSRAAGGGAFQSTNEGSLRPAS